MNEYEARLAARINTLCDKFLQKKIELIELQQNMEAIRLSIDGSANIALSNLIYRFVEDLEYIRFMVDQNDWYIRVTMKINTLLTVLDDEI